MLIYLPVETARREMVAKVFTATILASKGYPVALFKSSFFDFNGWPSPGVYVGKNCFRSFGFSEEKYYNKMKEEGIRVWRFDEEGGIYTGSSEDDWRKVLLKHLNPDVLREDDKILTWGEWQKQAYLELNPKCPVRVTGAPNFDIFSPVYADALSEFDRVETDGWENFILVNTRFSLSNGLISIKEHLDEESVVSQVFDRRSLRHLIAESGILQYSFISLVQELAEALPNEEIVLRPHPAEDPGVYQDLLADFSNISVEWRGDVRSWIRRCRALIHNGCTTAIQAQIAKKPVITYLPVNEIEEFSPGLPNLVGEKCQTTEAVLEALERNSVSPDPESLTRTISNAGAIDGIVGMIEEECPPPAGRDDLDRIVGQVMKSARHGKLRDSRKRLTKQILPKRNKANKNRGRKFDATFFRRVPEVSAAANEHFKCDVELLAPHPNCYLLVPRSRG